MRRRVEADVNEGDTSKRVATRDSADSQLARKTLAHNGMQGAVSERVETNVGEREKSDESY